MRVAAISGLFRSKRFVMLTGRGGMAFDWVEASR